MKIGAALFGCAIIVTAVVAIDRKANEVALNLNSDNLTVFVDAGHGGNDNGASSKSGRREKDDTLELSLAVRDALEARGVNVVMTRETDAKVPLEDLVKKANGSKADLFISLHRNSSETAVGGVEIWVNKRKPEIDTYMANKILQGLDDVGIQNNRGVKFGLVNKPESDYYVNKYTDMPSCLIELGFITDEKDNQYFDKNLKAYAKAIADGIVKTADKYA